MVWFNKGINTNGEYLNHLRFAKMQQIITKLDNHHSKLAEFNINTNRTKTMTNTETHLNILINDQPLEQAKHYIVYVDKKSQVKNARV